MPQQNQRIYTTANVVSYYAQLNRLQPAEATILKQFQDRWPEMKMLDIGIGGGRTTEHFAPRVADYVGMDYAADMIAACQRRFPNTSPHIRFEVGDARHMHQFTDHSFDFILFSFNGIDYVSHEERLKIFQEVLRVGKPGAYFFFSSHNLQGMEREFTVKKHLSLNPVRTYTNLVMLALLRLLNRSMTAAKLKAANHAILRDESHNFRLKTYYIRPSEQFKQLEPSFSNIKIFSWNTGLEILNQSTLAANVDMWLYYLCTIGEEKSSSSSL